MGYPELDLCADPQAICSNPAYPELKWIAGLFYWMKSVQTYDHGGWNYKANLKAFVDGGMTSHAFIDSVCGGTGGRELGPACQLCDGAAIVRVDERVDVGRRETTCEDLIGLRDRDGVGEAVSTRTTAGRCDDDDGRDRNVDEATATPPAIGE